MCLTENRAEYLSSDFEVQGHQPMARCFLPKSEHPDPELAFSQGRCLRSEKAYPWVIFFFLHSADGEQIFGRAGAQEERDAGDEVARCSPEATNRKGKLLSFPGLILAIIVVHFK